MERTNLVCRHGLQYHKKRLTKITHNGFDYTFAYDGFGNRKSVSIAGKAAVSHNYEAKNGTLLMSTYGGSVLSEKKNGVWQQVLIRTTRTDLRGKAV